jgi:hypothetical protein
MDFGKLIGCVELSKWVRIIVRDSWLKPRLYLLLKHESDHIYLSTLSLETILK